MSQAPIDNTMMLMDDELPNYEIVDKLKEQIENLQESAQKKDLWFRAKLTENSTQANQIKSLEMERDEMRKKTTELELERAGYLAEIEEMKAQATAAAAKAQANKSVDITCPLATALDETKADMLDDTNPVIVPVPETFVDAEPTRPDNVALDQSIANVSPQDTKAQEQLQVAEENNIKLKQENEKLTALLSEQDEKLSDYKLESDAEIKIFKEKIVDYDNQLKKKDDTIQEMLANDQENDSASKKIITKLQNDFDNLLKSRNNDSEKYQAKICDLESELNKNEVVYEELQHDFDKMKLTNEENLKNWQKSIEALQVELNEEKLEKSVFIQDQTICMDRMEQENTSLKEDVLIMDSLKAELKKLKAEMDHLRTENFEKTESETNLQSEIVSLRNEQKDNENLKETMAKLRNETTAFREEHERKLETFTTKEKEYQTQLLTYGQNEAQFMSQIKEITDEKESLKNTLKQLEHELVQSQGQSQTDLTKIEELEKVIEQKKAVFDISEEKLENLQNDLQETRDELEKLQKFNAENEKDNELLTQQLDDKIKDLERTLNEKEEVSAGLKESQEKIVTLETARDGAANLADKLAKEKEIMLEQGQLLESQIDESKKAHLELTERLKLSEQQVDKINSLLSESQQNLVQWTWWNFVDPFCFWTYFFGVLWSQVTQTPPLCSGTKRNQH